MTSDSSDKGPVSPDQQLVIAEMKQQLARYERAIHSMSPGQDDEDVIDLREYWNVLVRRKWTVFIAVVAMVIGTFIATSMMDSIFRATTVVQIERESGKVLEFQNVTAEESVNARDFYQTQYELLQSRTLARRVIDQLGLDSLEADTDSTGMLASVKETIKGFLSNDSATQDEEELAPDLEELFLENLTIEPVKNSRLVRISYDSLDREESALVANTLANSFVDMSLERRFEASTYAKTFLEERIKQVRADLEDSERELVRYSQERGIINQDDRMGILNDKLREMNRGLVEVQAELFEAESQYQEMLTASTASLAQMLDSPLIQGLKREKSDLESQYQEGLKIFKPAYPKMQQMREKITQIDADIAAEVAQIRDGIQVQYQAKLREEAKLQESIAATRNEILSLQERSTDFQTLKREVDTNRELYDGLLQRMKEVGVAAGVTNNNISIVDAAEVPRRPYKPNLKMNLAIALALGLFGGVLLAFLFESLDDTIKTGEDLEKLAEVPVLGIIPRIPDAEVPLEGAELYAQENPTSAFAEAYRSMRTSLMFSTETGSPKVLHFTSANPGEGKTTSAVSTAINFTQTGSNVLLIDGDLRNPSLHTAFDLDNQFGLTNYLAGEAKPAAITRPTPVKRLFAITSGPIPPNPAELLGSGKMVDLAALGAKRFDYVIIDSPPLLGLADALVLGGLAQATVLVVASGQTRSGALEAGLKRLRHSRINVLGTVLEMHEAGKAGYGYDYDYQYHYQYGRDETGRDTA